MGALKRGGLVKGMHDGNGKVEILQTPFERAMTTFRTTIEAGLFVAAIIGGVVMYGEQQRQREAITELSVALKTLAESTQRNVDQARMERELLRIGQEQLKARLTNLDRKLP